MSCMRAKMHNFDDFFLSDKRLRGGIGNSWRWVVSILAKNLGPV